MEIEHVIRYAPCAVVLKPPARDCEARLRGLWRIISSKTVIAVNVPTRGGSGGREVFVHHPRWLPRSEGGTPSRGGRGHDALAPMMVAALHAGATPAPPGSGGMRCVRARRPRTQAVEGCAACRRDAHAPRGAARAARSQRCVRARRLRTQAVEGCATHSRAPALPDACSDKPVPHQGGR